MKRFFLFFICSLIGLAGQLCAQGHFSHIVEEENVNLSEVESKFSAWLDLPENTNFVMFRDETDDLGIRHQSYQQYIDGIKVLNAVVLVHAKDNKVISVNGDILSEKVQMMSTKHPKSLIVRVKDGNTVSTRYAFEKTTDDHTKKIYIDAQTGEIIKTVPLVYNADVAGTATTMYAGTQPITCYEHEGMYFLMDDERGIITLDATDNVYQIDYTKVNQYATKAEADSVLSEEIVNLINGCAYIHNTSTNWNSSWNMQLTSVKIDDIIQNANWYTVGEGSADVYIKVKNATGAVLYTSGYYNDPTFPVEIVLTTPVNLTAPPYYVEIYDYDAVGEDDLIKTIPITTISGENSAISFSNVAFGKINIKSDGKQPLLDAHWGMEKTLDFYKQKFNRNSFDNQGSIVYNIVNPHRDTEGLSSFPINACAIPVAPYPMVYGMGMNSSETTTICTKPFVSIDIMAHEFSHLVTNNNGNGGLEYQGESGALNESFSDIMGISVKQYAMGSNDWLIGNNVMIYLSNMRSMKNPKNSNDGINGALSGPQPDTYGGQYWSDPADISNDNGGVHTNSGVQNYWFYLLSEGGTGTNDLNNQYNVIGIGIDKAAQIAYRNLIYYLTPEATFEVARNGSIMAATDLYGRNSHEVQAVVNAWYAVGVGDNLLPTALDRVSDASYANKYIRNGQILIQRGENIYTIQGQKLQ